MWTRPGIQRPKWSQNYIGRRTCLSVSCMICSFFCNSLVAKRPLRSRIAGAVALCMKTPDTHVRPCSCFARTLSPSPFMTDGCMNSQALSLPGSTAMTGSRNIGFNSAKVVNGRLKCHIKRFAPNARFLRPLCKAHVILPVQSPTPTTQPSGLWP